MRVQLGAGAVVAGFERGLMELSLGAFARIHCPARLGYGAAGGGCCAVPAGSDLVFGVELLQHGTTACGTGLPASAWRALLSTPPPPPPQPVAASDGVLVTPPVVARVAEARALPCYAMPMICYAMVCYVYAEARALAAQEARATEADTDTESGDAGDDGDGIDGDGIGASAVCARRAAACAFLRACRPPLVRLPEVAS
jgi:hypothetical protein